MSVQLDQQVARGGELKRQGARIAVVGQHQVKDWRGLQRAQIPIAVSDHRIPQHQCQPQTGVEPRRIGGRLRQVQHLRQLGGDGLRTLNAAAEIEKQPSPPSHHVLRRQTRDGGGERQHSGHRPSQRFQSTSPFKPAWKGP